MQVTDFSTSTSTGLLTQHTQLIFETKQRTTRHHRIKMAVLWSMTALLLLSCTPIWVPVDQGITRYTGYIADWAFTTLILSAILTCLLAYFSAYVWSGYAAVEASLDFRPVTLLRRDSAVLKE